MSNRGGQNTGWPPPDVQHTGKEHTHHRVPTQIDRHADVCIDKHKPTCAHIHAYNTCKCRHAITCTSSVCCAGGSLDSGYEIELLCCNVYKTKPFRTLQYVLYVRGSLTFPSFSFSASFFSAKSVLLTAFLQPSAPSVCFPSFSLSFFISLSLSLPWHSLVCQACNRAAIV